MRRLWTTAGGITGAGDVLADCDLLGAWVLAVGEPAIPAMGPDKSIVQRDGRHRDAVGIHRLAGRETQQTWAM